MKKQNIIGQNIKKFRTQAKLTQAQLAELCGVATGTIQQYELGKREPRQEQQLIICEKLKIFPTALLTGSNDPDIHTNFLNGMNDFKEALDATNGDLEKAYEIAALKIEMLSNFDALNYKGRKMAAAQIEVLTKVPEYRKDTE